jgi:hypothetical protein
MQSMYRVLSLAAVMYTCPLQVVMSPQNKKTFSKKLLNHTIGVSYFLALRPDPEDL